jgi:hypothetical protein
MNVSEVQMDDFPQYIFSWLLDKRFRADNLTAICEPTV